MFRYNPKANYQPNGGRYLQILSGKDLYKQTIVVSAGTHDTFPTRFPGVPHLLCKIRKSKDYNFTIYYIDLERIL